jgi:hypothetical protein
MFICSHCPYVVLLKQGLVDVPGLHAEGRWLWQSANSARDCIIRTGPDMMAKDAELGLPLSIPLR